MRWHRAARVLGLAAFGIGVVEATYFVGCVDGTTPDCSDAATQCGPDIDATGDRTIVEAALPEAAPQADAPSDTTVSPDAQSDADLDAGDGG